MAATLPPTAASFPTSRSAIVGPGDGGWTTATRIRDIARAKGIKFGSMFATADYNASAAYAALLASECDVFVASVEQKSAAWAASISGGTITFDWSLSDAWMAKVAAAGGKYRFHVLLYPPHDASWVNTTNVTSSNWMGLIDQMFSAAATKIAAYRTAYGLLPTSIDVTNENMDGNGTASYRSNPWFLAASANPFVVPGYTSNFTASYPAGASYITYCYYRARALFPTATLMQCHDLLEEQGAAAGTYYQNNAASVLTLMQQLAANGASVDGLNLQGHLEMRLPEDAVALRTFLQNVVALKNPTTNLPLKITVGELDVRTGTTPSSIGTYPTTEYDRLAAERVRLHLDNILPFLSGGELLVWGLSDTYNSWGASERPLAFDNAAATATTGTLTSGSKVVTGMGSTSGFLPTMMVYSTTAGIPAGTSIASVDTSTQITLSTAFTGTTTAGATIRPGPRPKSIYAEIKNALAAL